MEDEDFTIATNYCPWCKTESTNVEYVGRYDNKILRCPKCGMVFSEKILNEKGLNKYWGNYESELHLKVKQEVENREKMYLVEYEFIKKYINDLQTEILDVGCASGQFLDFFNKDGYNCYGVEYGKVAADISSKKYKVWLGELSQLEIDNKFDLIIFRGTIQYLLDPKAYFNKAIKLLNKDGLIFITSSPNADSICFRIFKEKFTLPVEVTDYYAYNEKMLTEWFENNGMKLLAQNYFYKETPYADVENDILKVAKAIELKKEGKEIEFKSPPFFDNMLTLVYKKL